MKKTTFAIAIATIGMNYGLLAQTVTVTAPPTLNAIPKFTNTSSVTPTVSSSNIFDNGSIGIGTNAPATPLHTNMGAFRMTDPASSARGVQINPSRTAYGDIPAGSSIMSLGSTTNEALSFLTNSSGTVAGGKLIACAYNNISGWKSIWETENTIGANLPSLLLVKNGGNVGIGTASPSQKLDVSGNVNISGKMNVASGVIQRGGSTITTTSDLGLYSLVSGNWMRFVTNGAAIKFYSDGHLADPKGTTALMSIESNGKVLIGNPTSANGPIPGTYKLYVETGILTDKVKVAVSSSTNWADYVFDEKYELLSLKEVEKFIQENKHLPNVPSAEQVVKEGIDMATMDAKLLEKIEELSLYIIAQNKRIENLEKQLTK